MNHIVYIELLDPTVQRWLYGAYATANQANEVASHMQAAYGNSYMHYCVCERSDEIATTVNGL